MPKLDPKIIDSTGIVSPTAGVSPFGGLNQSTDWLTRFGVILNDLKGVIGMMQPQNGQPAAPFLQNVQAPSNPQYSPEPNSGLHIPQQTKVIMKENTETDKIIPKASEFLSRLIFLGMGDNTILDVLQTFPITIQQAKNMLDQWQADQK